MQRKIDVSDNGFKIQIKEDFYYPITQISIDDENDVLIIYLADTTVYQSIHANLAHFYSVEKLDENEHLKTFDNYENISMVIKGQILKALGFLRLYDLFSENSYQKALEELNITHDSIRLQNVDEIKIASRENAQNLEVKISGEDISAKNKFFNFFSNKSRTPSKSSAPKKTNSKCTIQ